MAGQLTQLATELAWTLFMVVSACLVQGVLHERPLRLQGGPRLLVAVRPHHLILVLIRDRDHRFSWVSGLRQVPLVVESNQRAVLALRIGLGLQQVWSRHRTIQILADVGASLLIRCSIGVPIRDPLSCTALLMLSVGLWVISTVHDVACSVMSSIGYVSLLLFHYCTLAVAS